MRDLNAYLETDQSISCWTVSGALLSELKNVFYLNCECHLKKVFLFSFLFLRTMAFRVQGENTQNASFAERQKELTVDQGSGLNRGIRGRRARKISGFFKSEVIFGSHYCLRFAPLNTFCISSPFLPLVYTTSFVSRLMLNCYSFLRHSTILYL